jgi:hypothetical protein
MANAWIQALQIWRAQGNKGRIPRKPKDGEAPSAEYLAIRKIMEGFVGTAKTGMPKRPRGRPRKNAPAAIVEEAPAMDQEVPVEFMDMEAMEGKPVPRSRSPSPVAKKRGRPRKVVAPPPTPMIVKEADKVVAEAVKEAVKEVAKEVKKKAAKLPRKALPRKAPKEPKAVKPAAPSESDIKAMAEALVAQALEKARDELKGEARMAAAKAAKDAVKSSEKSRDASKAIKALNFGPYLDSAVPTLEDPKDLETMYEFVKPGMEVLVELADAVSSGKIPDKAKILFDMRKFGAKTGEIGTVIDGRGLPNLPGQRFISNRMVNPEKVKSADGPVYSAYLPFMHKGMRFYIEAQYAPDADDFVKIASASGPGIDQDMQPKLISKLYDLVRNKSRAA